MYAQLLRFFDGALRDDVNAAAAHDAAAAAAPFQMFAIGGGNGFASFAAWPPPEATPLRCPLGPGHSMLIQSGGKGGSEDCSASTAAGDFVREAPRRRRAAPGEVLPVLANDTGAGAASAASGAALAEAPRTEIDVYAIVERGITTGVNSRWNLSKHMLMARVDYAGRDAQARQLLTYTSAPLEQPLTIAGEVELDIMLEVNAEDGPLFAYLEAVLPDGRVFVVTESQLLLSHRRAVPARPPAASSFVRSFASSDREPMRGAQRVRLALLPIVWSFARGQRIRLALAGADEDNFVLPTVRATEWKIHRAGPAGTELSAVILPHLVSAF